MVTILSQRLGIRWGNTDLDTGTFTIEFDTVITSNERFGASSFEYRDDLIPDATAEEFSIPQGYTHMQTVKSSPWRSAPLFQVGQTKRPGEAALNEALNHTDEVYGGPRSQSVENTKWTHCLYMVSPEPKHCT